MALGHRQARLGGGPTATVPVEAPGGWDPATVAVWCAAVARTEPDGSLEITLPGPGGTRIVLVEIGSGAVRARVLEAAPDGPERGGAIVVGGVGAAGAARHLTACHLAADAPEDGMGHSEQAGTLETFEGVGFEVDLEVYCLVGHACTVPTAMALTRQNVSP
ncbi:hypothetical protein [Streptomyces sp. NPDC056817]|uniref:hypothetical protein n=1 Tax=Streptomyces sp. NPDC056817 TaxID=3345950 RepID=UPI0036CC0D75